MAAGATTIGTATGGATGAMAAAAELDGSVGTVIDAPFGGVAVTGLLEPLGAAGRFPFADGVGVGSRRASATLVGGGGCGADSADADGGAATGEAAGAAATGVGALATGAAIGTLARGALAGSLALR